MPTVRIDALNIDYYETGDGLPIIFIPGITEYKEEFAFQFRGLQDSYRVVSYDVRRGLKRASDYTLELLASDLKGLLTALKVDSAVICGHSFGGLIAQEFALRYPEDTDALILVSGFASPPPVLPDRLFGWISTAGHPLHRSLGTSFRVHLARLLGTKASRTLAMVDEVTAVRSVARQAEKTSRTTITQRLRLIETTDFTLRLPEITAPTLIVAGSKDHSVFLSSAQQLYEGIPDSVLEVVEGGGHFCFLTRHDQFNTVVDEFLTNHLMEITG